MVRVHLKITGRVQGVGFRWATQDEATRLGVTGWVRNTDDGAVEALAEGDEERIERFVAWCRSGPPGARVHRLEERRRAATNEFDSFRITY
jgi:acylphosphatase